jgi:hypothetical protein
MDFRRFSHTPKELDKRPQGPPGVSFNYCASMIREKRLMVLSHWQSL